MIKKRANSNLTFVTFFTCFLTFLFHEFWAFVAYTYIYKKIKNRIPKNKIVIIAEAIFNSKMRYGVLVHGLLYFLLINHLFPNFENAIFYKIF